jgi:hypothetical protein
LAYWAHKHQHMIGTFNTCSRGPTHWSLIDTRGGYCLEGAGFAHTTPRPSQPAVFTFHLGAPPGLQFNQVLATKSKCRFKEPMSATESFDHSAIYRGIHLHLVIANDLSLAIGSTRIGRKVIVIQLGCQFNSYNLMHIQKSYLVLLGVNTLHWGLPWSCSVLTPSTTRVLALHGLSQI